MIIFGLLNNSLIFFMSMSSSENSDQETNKILDKMFVYADNKDINFNRIRNLIVNPEILRVLIHHLESFSVHQKIRVIGKVADVYKRNTLNSCIIIKRDKQILEFNHSIFDQIISFILSFKIQFQQNMELFKIIKPLVSGYLVGGKNIKNVISKISKNFHSETFNFQKLQLSLLILKEMYKSQPVEPTLPKCYFCMYGPNSGVKLINQQLKWTLAKGMYIYLNFYMESQQHQEMSIFHLNVNNDSFQLSIDEENFLTVKVFQGNKVNRLRKLAEKKWYFLRIAYCLRSGIIRNSFELIAYIEGEPFQLRDLPVPNTNMQNNIDELIIGHQFYGRINIAAISRKQMHYWPKNGINNWGQLQGLLAANNQTIKEIFLLYSPLITTEINENEILYEISSKNHSEILENTAIYNNPFDEVDINYYGGLYSLLPFFYILKFYKYGTYPEALEEIFQLVLTIFKYGYQNVQSEAVNCQFFGIIAQFMNQIDQRYITLGVLSILKSLKQLIDIKPLKKQFLQHFLFKIRLDRIENTEVIYKIHELIQDFYHRQFIYSSQTYSLYDVIWYVIDNFEPEKKQQCCLLHCWEQSQSHIDEQKILEIEQHYKNKSKVIKQLLKSIIKTLCATRKYGILFRKNVQTEGEEGIGNYSKRKKKENFTFFDYLKYNQYSICLKKLLLESLLVGVQQDPQKLIKETSLLDCLYQILETAELRDQFVPIVKVLAECSKALSTVHNIKNLQIIKEIGSQLDKMYTKKYSEIRLRSRSEGISLKKKVTNFKLFNELEDNESCTSQLREIYKQKQKQFHHRIVKLRKQKNSKISNDKQLYELLTGICCVKEIESGEYILANDDTTKIIYPYFKICITKYKVNLIEIIKSTILARSKLDTRVPLTMQSLSEFDQIYRFIISEFILKELDLGQISRTSEKQENFIIKKFFFIIDSLVISMKNDWDRLYMLTLRLISIITEAKKQIHSKTQMSKSDILLASKVCVRKFILRVLNYAEKSIENMGNMVFLVYLVVFNNSPIVQNQQLFEYFSPLKNSFFIGPISIENQDKYEVIDKNIFVDETIILAYLDGFRMQEVFNKEKVEQAKKRRYMINLIYAHFEKQQTNELQDYLFKLRTVFLSKSSFKDILSEDNSGIRKMFSKFIIGNEETKNRQIGSIYDLHVCQLIGLLISLVVEASIQTHRVQILKQSLQKYVLFVKSFALSCSRDGLKKKDHKYRNQKIPAKLVYYMIHFLYQMLEKVQENDQQYRELVQEALYEIFSFLTILMTSLCEKVGNPGNVSDLLMLANVMHDVQEYNFFSFQVIKGVMTLDYIRLFSSIGKQKAISDIQNLAVREHFKISPTVFLQKHIKQAVEIHKMNIQKIEIELSKKFELDNVKRSFQQEQIILNDDATFEEHRLQHARKIDYEYRNVMRVWRKIWKRLRLYHYFWSISMDQKQEMEFQWQKSKFLPYKHKFGKYTDLDGLRPILQIQPNQPWHVKKSQIDEQMKYRNNNFMLNLYKLQSEKNIRQKSIIDIIMLRKSSVALDYFSVQWIKHNSKRKGRLSIINNQKMLFQYESTFQKDSHVDFTSFTLAQHRAIQKAWPLVSIVNIIRRRYLMRSQCLLIEFEDSSSIILDFLNNETQQFLAKIQKIQAEKSQMYNFMKANKIAFYTKKFKKATYSEEIQEALEMWSQGKITNLQYLMLLNKYSGRSYLDPVNYPILPWIIEDYDRAQFRYRNLSKTLGYLGSSTRKQFYEKKAESTDPFNNAPPYQYGTHYSSPGVVFNFFIRITPYTQAGRTLQGGKFDLSDRLFSSINICWNSVRNQVSDVRQLNPEFFYLPQFLINIDNYDFGLTQMKQRIDHVKLPVWAKNPYQFIRIHRKSLEEDYVSGNMNGWIDLIFGYKQKGKIAKQNLNLYYYLTYEDSVDLQTINDPVERTSIQAQIIHFGQTPSQIFTKPHPVRKFRPGSKQFTETKLINCLGIVESKGPFLLLGEIENSMFVFFNNFNIVFVQKYPFEIKKQVPLVRSSSKQGFYFLEDINVGNKIQLFGNNRFIAVSCYINGDLVIYNISCKKVYQTKITPNSIIYVNKNQTLLLCGARNGLLDVYEIVYGEKDSVNLIKIVSEYFLFPIENISEGAGFYSIANGNLVVLNKITRGLSYVHDKVKMQGSKLIRSFESRKKVSGSFIVTNPLYCVVLYNTLQIFVYSINGQFLKSIQVEIIVNPVLMVDYLHRQCLLVVDPLHLLVIKIPELLILNEIKVPKKEYAEIKIIKDKVYLVSKNGQLLLIFNQKEVKFS